MAIILISQYWIHVNVLIEFKMFAILYLSSEFISFHIKEQNDHKI